MGSWYEPAVFYHDEEQRRAALESRATLQERLSVEHEAAHGTVDGAPVIVTRVRPAAPFWPAANEHQR